MFEFTTTTLINSNVDTTSGKTKVTADATNKILKVLRVGNFKKDSVTALYKRVGYNGTKATAVFAAPTAPASDADYYRIVLTLKAIHWAPEILANAASVYKMKDLTIEFKATTGQTATQIGDAIVAAVKYQQQDQFPLITASNNAGAVTITAVNEYLNFTSAKLQKLVSATTSVYPDDQLKFVDSAVGTITKGKEGFGTYMYVISNLRIPTLEARRFTSPTEEELPLANALYNQYTLHYKEDCGTMGTDAVGDQVTSVTTHVFFVLSTLAATFEAAITAAGITFNTVGDDGKLTPTNPA